MTAFHSFMLETLLGLLKKLIGEFRETNHGAPLGGGRVAAIDTHLNALWQLPHNGCAWRALPSEFGPWRAIHQYFNRLSRAGFFEFIQDRMITGDTSEAVFMDSTHCKVHRPPARQRPRKPEGQGHRQIARRDQHKNPHRGGRLWKAGRPHGADGWKRE